LSIVRISASTANRVAASTLMGVRSSSAATSPRAAPTVGCEPCADSSPRGVQPALSVPAINSPSTTPFVTENCLSSTSIKGSLDRGHPTQICKAAASECQRSWRRGVRGFPDLFGAGGPARHLVNVEAQENGATGHWIVRRERSWHE
jgi:hypothetical protein